MIPTMFSYLPYASAVAIHKMAEAKKDVQEGEEPSYGQKAWRAFKFSLPVAAGTGMGYFLGRTGAHLLDQRAIAQTGRPMLSDVSSSALKYILAGLGATSGALGAYINQQQAEEISRRAPPRKSSVP